MIQELTCFAVATGESCNTSADVSIDLVSATSSILAGVAGTLIDVLGRNFQRWITK